MVEDKKIALPCPRIVCGQQALTEEQRAYARHFAQVGIANMLSPAAIDEAEAEAHLRQAYQVVGATPPRIRWFDSPIPFVLACAPRTGEEPWDQVWDHVKARDLGSDLYNDDLHSKVWPSMGAYSLASMLHGVRDNIVASVW